MAMTPATLSTELQKIANTEDEAVVRSGWASAYTKYMKTSAVLGVSPLSEAVLAGAKSTMDSALIGISTPKTALVAAQLIVAAIKTFWTTALAAGVTVWVTIPPLVPTPVTLPTNLLLPPVELVVAQALEAVFTANTSGGLSKEACYAAIAAVLHPAGAGATVTQATLPNPTPGNVVT